MRHGQFAAAGGVKRANRTIGWLELATDRGTTMVGDLISYDLPSMHDFSALKSLPA